MNRTPTIDTKRPAKNIFYDELVTSTLYILVNLLVNNQQPMLLMTLTTSHNTSLFIISTKSVILIPTTQRTHYF